MPAPFTIRPYRGSDRASWLRCRLLAFFDTCYHDDVWTTRPTYHHPSIELVAGAPDQQVVGLIDVEISGAQATIETVAVHPDARRQGIAGALLGRVLAALPPTVRTLNAWTREDVAANFWYRRNGFVEERRYLHVYKSYDEPADGFVNPEGLVGPKIAFLHGRIEDEARLRQRFRRVYVCRRYVRQLGQGRTSTRG